MKRFNYYKFLYINRFIFIENNNNNFIFFQTYFMKYFLLGFILLSSAYCYDPVYDLGDGTAIMSMNYLLTGILVPWVICFFLCIVSCVFCCCIPKKYRAQPAFVSVPQQQIVVQQPMQPMGTYGQPAYGQPAYGQPAYGQPAYGQQVMSPMTNVGQPMMGEVKQ